MATYEEIYGKRVKEFDSDPTLESSYEGQVWYDKSTGVLKSVVSFGAFASAANMGTARYGHGSTGEVSSIIANGGTTGSGTTVSEEYNGSGWGTGGSMNTSRFYISDFGNSQTAAVAVNGRSPGETFMNDVEEYNGTSWTTATDTPYNSNNTNTFGILTAGVSAGGNNTSSPATTTVAEYDGTNWTAGTSLPTAMRESIVGGTQTAGFVASGGPGPSDNVNHFQYDGTNWTVAGNVNTQRMSAASGGTQTYAIGASGYDNPLQYLTSSSVWDGSSWAAGATVAVGRYGAGKGSTSTGTSDVFCGGQTKSGSSYPNPGATEEYNFSINTITAAAWSSGDNMPAVVYRNTGFGTQTAGVVAGGSNTSAQPSTTNAFKYDGSSWTSTGALGTARRGLMSAGTQTAGLVFAGSGGGSDSNVNNESEEFNGSTFSEGNNCNTSVSLAGGSGSQTSAVKAGGYTGSGNSSASEEYEGTSWTSGNSINTARRSISQVGEIPNAKLIGGETSGGSQNTNVEDYDGTSWTNGTALLVADKGAAAAAGTPSACIVSFGRNPSTVVATAQGWDGTSWFTQPSGATARAMVGGNGTSTAAFIAGGETSSLVANTENFDGESSAVSFKTLTTS